MTMAIQLANPPCLMAQSPISIHGSDASDVDFVVVNTAGSNFCFLVAKHHLIEPQCYSKLFFWSAPQTRLAVSDWETAPTHPIAELRALVTSIRDRTPLSPPSAGFDELLTRAAALHGVPDNISAWADKLSADIADLVD